MPVTDSQAHKLEVWIPLPREDGWQRVEALSIDTSSQHEIVTQDIYGNRLLHIVANSPLPNTLSATIRFQVTRREQAADVTRAMRDLAEPSDGPFALFYVAIGWFRRQAGSPKSAPTSRRRACRPTSRHM